MRPFFRVVAAATFVALTVVGGHSPAFADGPEAEVPCPTGSPCEIGNIIDEIEPTFCNVGGQLYVQKIEENIPFAPDKDWVRASANGGGSCPRATHTTVETHSSANGASAAGTPSTCSGPTCTGQPAVSKGKWVNGAPNCGTGLIALSGARAGGGASSPDEEELGPVCG